MNKILRVLISRIGVTDLILSERDALALYQEWCNSPNTTLHGVTLDGVRFFFCGPHIAGLLLLPQSPQQQNAPGLHGIGRPLPGSSGYQIG